MTAPGGSSGEGSDNAPASPWVGGQPLDQPVSDATWASPAAPPPVADYPPTQDYPLTGYPPPLPYPGGYQPDPAAGYPAPGPAGYQTYGAPYQPPPMPGPYGAAPGGYPGAYPGGYYAPPDYGAYGAYGAGYGALQSGMNTLAIVSLVSGIIGIFCCVSSIVGIVCGTISLNQIKQTREDGYGLAIAGIVLSVATVLVYFVIMMVSASH